MKKWLVVANSVLAFPFLYILTGALLSWAADAVHLGGEIVGFLFGAPLMLAYVLLPDFGPILIPLLAAFTVFSIWKIWPERRILLGCYLAVFFLYGGYVVWWHATGQKVHLEF